MTLPPELHAAIDYTVFALVLIISLAIGVYYSCNQSSTDEYLHGRRQMGLFPVSVSLFVSFVSAITMQGMPAEVYLHGLEIMLSGLSMWGISMVAVTFLPIYYELKLTSVYQYLEIRFGTKLPKAVASFIGMVTMVLYSGIILYGPASALESLSGIPTDYFIIIMAVVCTLYTSVGGIRGVIWTDVFQAFVMLLGCVCVLIIGVSKLGLSTIWNELEKHGRTEINFNLNPAVRNSFWICLFSMAFSWFSIFSNQTAMVRYTSLPTLTQARLCLIIGGFGVVGLQLLSSSVGAVVFAYYSVQGCGPIASGEVYSSNQVVPYFVVDVLNYPGVPGVFIAAIVASTMSSASSTQNALVAIVWKDLLAPFFPNMSDFRKTVLLKVIVGIFGVIGVLIAFMAKYAGDTLYNITSTILGAIGAPPFGMFLLGATFTFTSGTAATIGCVVSCCFSVWITMGKLVYGTTWVEPSLVDDTCNSTVVWGGNNSDIYTAGMTTSSLLVNSTGDQGLNPTIASLYSISSYAYPTFSILITYTVGLVLSLLPAFRHRKPVDPKLLIPFCRKFFWNQRQEDPKAQESLMKLQYKDTL